MAIHAFIKGTFCFAYVLFAILGARDKVDYNLQFVRLSSFTDASEDDLSIWVGVISLHVKHLLLPQGFDSPVGASSLGSGLSFA